MVEWEALVLEPRKPLERPQEPWTSLERPLELHEGPLEARKPLERPLQPRKSLERPLELAEVPLEAREPLERPLEPRKSLERPLELAEGPLEARKPLERPLEPRKSLERPLELAEGPLETWKPLERPLEPRMPLERPLELAEGPLESRQTPLVPRKSTERALKKSTVQHALPSELCSESLQDDGGTTSVCQSPTRSDGGRAHTGWPSVGACETNTSRLQRQLFPPCGCPLGNARIRSRHRRGSSK